MNDSTRRSERSFSPLAKLGYVVMGLFFVLIIGSFSTCTFGHVGGEEFDPVTFDRREFHYWEVPLIHVQVWPTMRSPSTTAMESYLQAQKLIPPADSQAQPQEWDLVVGQRIAGRPVHGEAAILCAYLDVQLEDGKHAWMAWSDKHPKRAATLWKEVAWLARQRLYYRIPDLLELAKAASGTPVKFQQQVDRQMADWLAEIADIHRRNDDVSRAAELLDAALLRQPDDRRLQDARAALPAPRAEAGG